MRCNHSDLSSVGNAIKRKLVALYPEMYEEIEGIVRKRTAPDDSAIAVLDQLACSGSLEEPRAPSERVRNLAASRVDFYLGVAHKSAVGWQ